MNDIQKIRKSGRIDQLKDLLESTHDLLTLCGLSPDVISELDGITSSVRWIYKFKNRQMEDPGVIRVNELRNVLLKVKLPVRKGRSPYAEKRLLQIKSSQ